MLFEFVYEANELFLCYLYAIFIIIVKLVMYNLPDMVPRLALWDYISGVILTQLMKIVNRYRTNCQSSFQ